MSEASGPADPGTPPAGAPEANDELEQPVLVPPRGLVPVILVVLTAVAALAITAPADIRPTARASLRLVSWRPTPARLAAIDASRAAAVAPGGEPALPADLVAALRDQLRATLLDEARIGYQQVRADPRSRATLGRFEEALRHLGLTRGKDALHAFAIGYAREVGGAARTAYQDAVGRGLSLAAASQGKPPPKSLLTLENLAPGVGRTLSRVGLEEHVGPDGLDPAAQLVIEALVEQGVYELARRLPGDAPQLSSELYRLLLAFRVEAHAGLPLARKLALLEELSGLDPTYPALYTTAGLLARGGRLRAARDTFLRAAAAGQFREQAMANARWCRERLSAMSRDATKKAGSDG